MKNWNCIPQISETQYSYLIGHNINEMYVYIYTHIHILSLTIKIINFQAFKSRAILYSLSGSWFLSGCTLSFLGIKSFWPFEYSVVKKDNEYSVVNYYYKKDFEDLENTVFFYISDFQETFF